VTIWTDVEGLGLLLWPSLLLSQSSVLWWDGV